MRCLVVLMLLAAEALAGPLRVDVKPTTATWSIGKPVDVKLEVVNVSTANVTFEVMSCGWDESWKSSDAQLAFRPFDCDKNAPQKVALAAGASRAWTLPMFAVDGAKLGDHRLTMTFTPRGGSATTSAAVAIKVAK